MILSGYGLLIGFATVVFWTLIEKKAQKIQFSNSLLNRLILISTIFGLIGGRLFHLSDHWATYHTWGERLSIHLGGLSIIGVFLGGVFGSWLYLFLIKKTESWLEWLDLVALTLPVAQAIGRWGNYVNQELYGWPTNLVWGIYIKPENRLAGFESLTHFHPLFAYEMMALIFLAVYWWFGPRLGDLARKKIGSGWYIHFYVIYYSIIRILLDFIRIDKIHIFDTILGKNQLLLLIFLGLYLGLIKLGLIKYDWRK